MLATERDWEGEFEAHLGVERSAFKTMQTRYVETLPHLNPASAVGAELCMKVESATAEWRKAKAEMAVFMDQYRRFG